jgi:hypothetical protein
MLPTHLRHGDLHRIRDLTRTGMRSMGAVGQSRELFTQIPVHPAMQGRPVHPDPGGDRDHISPCQHSPDRVQALIERSFDLL